MASVTAGGSGVWRRRNLAILPATTVSFCRCKPLLHCLGQQPLYKLRRRTGCLPLFEYADSHSPGGTRGFTEQRNDLLQRRFHLGWLWIEPDQFVQNTCFQRTAADIRLLVTGALAWQQVARSEQPERHIFGTEEWELHIAFFRVPSVLLPQGAAPSSECYSAFRSLRSALADTTALWPMC